MNDPSQRFAADMTYEAATSLRDCGRAFQQVMLDAAMHGGWGSSGLAQSIIDVIEAGGGKFIDATALRFEAAWNWKGADRNRLKTLYRQGLDQFLKATETWGRDNSNAFGDSQDARLNLMRPQLSKRLHQRLSHVIRSREGAPPKPWRERHPIWWQATTNLISGLVGLAVGLLGKHLP